MKMGFIFNEVFWGVLLIVLGASVVIKVLFNLDIPIFRVILAFILIYAGIRILAGGFGFEKPKDTILFDDSTIKITNPIDNYNIIFGRGVIDLTEVSLGTGTAGIEINTIFGGGVIKINPATPLKIVMSSAFAETKMPDGNNIHFGEYTYQSKSFKGDQAYLLIKTNVAFGGLEIIDK